MREDLKKIGEMKETISCQHQTPIKRFDPEAPTQAELDIMKEKAEALGRTGERLDEGLRRLRILDERIGILERKGKGLCEVNALVREFNQVRARVLQCLHFLIIQREAIGFRRHANVQRMYKIPPKKRSLPGEDVREDHHP